MSETDEKPGFAQDWTVKPYKVEGKLRFGFKLLNADGHLTFQGCEDYMTLADAGAHGQKSLESFQKFVPEE